MKKYINIRIEEKDYKFLKRIKRQTGHPILHIIHMYLTGQMKTQGEKK